MDAKEFFQLAFQRNVGLVSVGQQEFLRNCRVGVAGLGGVGGAYVLSLVRLGIGAIVVADFDHFEIANMNRQAGATASTLGRSKSEVIREMALAINPHLKIEVFAKGIDSANIDSFIAECDVVIDAIDFYCINIHRLLHSAARKANKYSLFSVPLGFSATVQVFSPKGMSFEDYFDFSHCHDFFAQMAAFAVGTAPKGTHWSYMRLTGEELAAGNPPSLNSSVNLCSGVVTSSVLLILLGQWDEGYSAPQFYQWDSRKFTLARGRLFWGNRSLWQRVKRWIVEKRFGAWRQKINERFEVKQKNFDGYSKIAV